MNSPPANCYDYPQYWDMAFRDETEDEADFFEQAFKRYSQRSVKRLLEPGCGGGRLVVELAARGYEVSGFDISESAIAYLQQRLEELQLGGNAYVDDMTTFQVAEPYDAVFNTFNTFRHLLDDDAARSHLQAVANALAPGGLFILGLHVIPPDADDEDEEQWAAEEGGVSVEVMMKIANTDWKKRLEVLRFELQVEDAGQRLRIETDYTLRLYRAEQLRELVESVDAFEWCDVFDFWYDIDEPQQLDDVISDTVLVLRKR